MAAVSKTRFVIKTINKISPAGLARFSPERYRIKPAEDEPEVAHAIMLRSHKMTDADVPAVAATEGAVLVGVTSTALALAETIVSDVADRNSGMYTAARSFLPAVARLRARLERKAARAEARIEMAAASAKPAPPRGLAALLTPPAPPPEPRPAASLDPGLS